MITTLWVMTVSGIVAMAALLVGRDVIHAARNRVFLDRAYWLAAGCAARAQAAINDRLREAPSLEGAAAIWRTLDRAVLPVNVSRECAVTLEAAGTRLDVNETSEAMLASLFGVIGYGGAAADLASALVAHRDSAGPFADLRAVSRESGFENFGTFDTVLSVEPGRVSLATASVTVLLSVPGVTREAAERFAALRDAGTPAPDATAILGDISRASAESLMANYSAIVRATTADPDAWLLVVRAGVGEPVNSVELSRRLVRSGKRVTVVSTRSAL